MTSPLGFLDAARPVAKAVEWPGKRRPARTWAVCTGVAAAAVLLGAVAWARISRWVSDPAVPLLLPDWGAEWIIADEPFRLACRKLKHYKTIFQTSFEPAAEPRSTVLNVKAFKVAAVFLDGTLVAAPREDFERWKEPVLLDLKDLAGPGRHSLQIQVVNENGPAALIAACEGLDLRTGRDWITSLDGQAWAPARLASDPRMPEIARQFRSTGQALLASFPFLAAAFALAAGSSLWWSLRGSSSRWSRSPLLTPSAVRWSLIFAWVLLGANNHFKVPEYVGFDALQHLDYIRYVAERGAIPLASEGWQMFQSPLYYLLSAPLHVVFSWLFEPETVVRILRIVPLAAGTAQVQLCYLAVCRLFPARRGLQALGTLMGGLLPMNIYLSQGLGNEPLAALLGGGVMVVAMGLVSPSRGEAPIPLGRTSFLLGLLLGLALLTKVSAVLLVPPVLAAVAAAAWRGGSRPILRGAVHGGLVILTAAAVSGWYYLRNWIALGKPVFTGWDPGRDILWWQDPGFRTLEQLTRFGESLVHPVYSAPAGFWDALYSTFWTDGYLSMVISYAWRPPWNYDLMISGSLLGLIPSAAMLLGAASPVLRAGRDRWKPIALASACIAIYLAALFCLFASLPIYSTGKATYLAGLTPCFAVLAAAGFDLLTRRPLLRAAVHGSVAAWAAAAYAAYFVA